MRRARKFQQSFQRRGRDVEARRRDHEVVVPHQSVQLRDRLRDLGGRRPSL